MAMARILRGAGRVHIGRSENCLRPWAQLNESSFQRAAHVAAAAAAEISRPSFGFALLPNRDSEFSAATAAATSNRFPD
jgi:hypothetical protein